MALRVLLADESTTIKKVIQLALQDYGVEVKSVPVGLDVIPVAKSFQPDLILVDVLLQKKSGYEVAKEIKEDSQLKAIPVVLMWSGFMEIDEAKAQASGAEKRLEKPFDADLLRQIVKDLVPRTLENKISSYLTFPKLPDFADEPAGPMSDDKTGFHSLSEQIAADSGAESAGSGEDIYAIPEVSENDIQIPTLESADDLPPEDQFSNVPLTATKEPQLGPEETWTHQDLSKIKIDTPMVAEGDPLNPDLDKYMIPAEELNLARVESNGEFEEVTFAAPKTSAGTTAPDIVIPETTQTRTNATPSMAAAPSTGSRSAMDQVMAEKIMREEAQAILEKIAWQILPDICERVVREELGKLLKDVERSI